MPSPAELRALLEGPNESLAIEHKDWLDFSKRAHKALLAKAAMALANYGGGIIVLGMRAQEDAGPLKSQLRPDNISRYTQDDLNGYINSFADPKIHCELAFEAHPVTEVEHAFVIVPGGISVPVMCRSTCEDVVIARKCYIRKPGPKSEEPYDAQEWRTLMDRCVRASRADMLDAIRAIVLGTAGTIPEPPIVRGPVGPPAGVSREAIGFIVAGDARVGASGTVTRDGLKDFAAKAHVRWEKLVSDLPPDDVARFPNGYYEQCFQILGAKPLPSLAELLRALKEAGSIRHTGWGPFAQVARSEYVPKPVDGTIEAWFGRPAERMLLRDPAHCDFWRADTTGRLMLLRGYDEDGLPNREPGKWIDVTLPVWRVGETILYVGRLAAIFGKDLSFLVRCRFTGLEGRILTSIQGNRMMFDERRCVDSEVIVEREITVSQSQDNLVEVLHPLLSPLYERFSFFELSEKLVSEEVGRLTRGRF
jgi:hypothetical protein